MIAVRDRFDEFGGGIDVAVITFTDPAFVEAYRREHQLPFPVLVDADRSAYGAYGLGRGSVGRVWGWRTMRRYAQILRSSGIGRLERATEDTLQLGGDFVVGPDGTLVWGFWGDGPDDRPAVDTLLTALPPNA